MEKIDPNSVVKTKPSEPEPWDRTGLVTTIYHHREPGGGEPGAVASFEFRHARDTPPAGEDPWARQIKVGEEWQALDYGWLAEGSEGGATVGVVALENTTGKGQRQVQPTPEQLAAEAGQVLLVSFAPGEPLEALRVPPGASLVCSPSHPASVRVRSLTGTCPVRLVALPKAPE